MAPKKKTKGKSQKDSGQDERNTDLASAISGADAPGTPESGQLQMAQNDSKDTIDLKSDDSIDEFSPLVKNPTSADGACSSPSGKSRSKRESGGKSTKNFYERTPQDGASSSSENVQQTSCASLPIQTRVDWVRLASFDHFEDENATNPEAFDDSNPSQSTSTSSPDSEGNHAPSESRKFILGDREDLAISCEENPPPSWNSEPDKKEDDVFVDAHDPWEENAKLCTNLGPPSPHPQRAGESIAHQRLMMAARTVHASVRISRLERARRRAKWAGKKFLVFLVSHIGLTLAVLLYATAGGFLFRWLEVEEEIDRRNNMMEVRYNYLDQMWLETKRLNVLHHANWTRAVRGILMKFERRVYKSISDGTWDGAGEDVVSKWTIPGSLLFSTTVITSIGYGDITPRTVAGKLVCIPFAIIGIPLTLLCLANIGQLLAVAFKFLWRRMLECRNLCRYCQIKDKKTASLSDGDSHKETRIPILVCVVIIVGYTLGGAAIFSSWEKGWTFLDGFYFSFITLSTIGFGDFVPGQYEKGTNERRVVCTLYLLTGLALLSMVFQLMIDTVRDITRRYAEIFGLTEEQIARDVKGLDNPIQVQVAPEPIIVVTPDLQKGHDDGDKSNNVVCCVDQFIAAGGKQQSEDVASKRADDVIEIGGEEGKDENQGSTSQEEGKEGVAAAKNALVPPSIFISVSEDDDTRDPAGINGGFPNDTKLESDPAEIHLGSVGEIEYSDFVPTLPVSDSAVPVSGSMKTFSSLNEIESEREQSTMDGEKAGNFENSSKSLPDKGEALEDR